MKTRTLLFTFLALFTIGLIAFQSSCKKENEEPPGENDELSIPETTKVIDNSIWNNYFISIDSLQYTFTFKKELINDISLSVGDILVAENGHGHLRKIANIQTVSNEILIETSPACLSEAIENGSFSLETVLSEQKIMKINYFEEGVRIDTSHMKNTENTALNYEINIYLDDAKKVYITGSYSIIPTVKWAYKIRWFKSNRLDVKFVVEEIISLSSTIELLNIEYEKERKIATVEFNPILVLIGNVPVKIVPEIDLMVGANLNVESSVTTSITQQVDYVAGLLYENKEWSPYKERTEELTYLPPTLSANAEAKIYVKPQLNLKVYGFVAPYLFGDIYGRIEADIQANPWWSLYGGAGIGVGVKGEILDEELFDYYTDPSLINYEVLIANASLSLIVVTDQAINITQDGADVDARIDFSDSDIQEHGHCWSTQPNPTISLSTKTELGFVSENDLPINYNLHLSGLEHSTPYFVRAYAINMDTTVYGNEITFTTQGGGGGGEPCPGTPTVTDNDGNVYNTVLIGSQCWMKENLNVGTMINNETGGSNNDGWQTDNGTIEKWCYDNSTSNCDTYGGLYQWNEMMQYLETPGEQGICPSGWHIPTKEEWTILIDYLGGSYVAGGKMKTTGTIQGGNGLWNEPNTDATNESGYTGIPAGYGFCGLVASFLGIGNNSFTWSSSPYVVQSHAISNSLRYDSGYSSSSDSFKKYGKSVRCLKD